MSITMKDTFLIRLKRIPRLNVAIQMSPLRGLGLWGSVFLHRCHPYGIQEGFEGFKVSAAYPVRFCGVREEIRRNTLSIRRNTQAKTPQAKPQMQPAFQQNWTLDANLLCRNILFSPVGFICLGVSAASV